MGYYGSDPRSSRSEPFVYLLLATPLQQVVRAGLKALCTGQPTNQHSTWPCFTCNVRSSCKVNKIRGVRTLFATPRKMVCVNVYLLCFRNCTIDQSCELSEYKCVDRDNTYEELCHRNIYSAL